MKDLFLAVVFLAAIFGTAIQQFAPDVWAQILHLLGL